MITIKKTKEQQGTTLIEVAAILPLLFWLTFGMIDFGRYLYAISTIQSAAQEGARVGLGKDGIVDLVGAAQAAQKYAGALNGTEIAISVQQPTVATIEVALTYQFEFITPLPTSLFPDNQVEIHGAATMVIY